MTKSKLVWALLDNRTGNRSQVIGVLEELKIRYKVIEIRYNFFSFLPNFILQLISSTIHIKSIKSFLSKPRPDMIISCGRRTALVALKLKSYFINKPFCIHLMYPRFTLNKNKFNLIFTPEHDNIKETHLIKNCLGTPNNINLPKRINIKKRIDKPIVFLIIGGNHGRFVLSDEEINNLLHRIISKLNGKGTILITTSRRTSKKVILGLNSLEKKFSIIKEVYHVNNGNKKNNYLKNLSLATEIIVTGDSMSMVSEACETKKPVRIYYNDRFCSKKHIIFCDNLIKKKYAFTIDSLGKKCKITKRLNTSKKIALNIKKSFKYE